VVRILRNTDYWPATVSAAIHSTLAEAENQATKSAVGYDQDFLLTGITYIFAFSPDCTGGLAGIVARICGTGRSGCSAHTWRRQP
jgi:hypothetical protein